MKNNLMRLASVAAIAAGMAFAQTPAQPPQQPPARTRSFHRRGMWHRRMMQQLNLTDVQKQQAKAIFQQTRESVRPVREQLKQNREALAAAVKADNTAEIHNLAAKQATLQSRMVEARADAMAKFYATLTPEQRAKSDQLHQQFRQRMEQRMQQRKAERSNS